MTTVTIPPTIAALPLLEACGDLRQACAERGWMAPAPATIRMWRSRESIPGDWLPALFAIAGHPLPDQFIETHEDPFEVEEDPF